MPVAASAQPAPTPLEQTGIVYYQVTFADGTVRDLNEIPKEKEGIRRVVRISRFEPAVRGYEVISTGHPMVKSVRPGRTIKHELIWNDRAWVGPEQDQAPSSAAAGSMPDVIGREIHKTKTILKALHERLGRCDHAVAAAERKLAQAASTDDEPTAKANLEKAQHSRRRVLEAIGQYERQLASLKEVTEHKNPDRPTGGPVEYLSQPPAGSDLGIVEPTTRRAVLPHQMHVWKLDRSQGERTYTIAMAHPEAGKFGAFHYVAYADTNGDGRPDKLIARSPLARADAPGQWSRWSFTTSEPTIFVGNAWPAEYAGVYCHRAPPEPGNWRGLNTEVYVSPVLGVMPTKKWTAWPYFTNLQIYVNQNPDAPSSAGGVKIITN